jgi:hypothetical protein
MRRKPKAKTDIDVVPYLSIMVIVLKLICLILIVVLMPIALNPKLLSVMSFERLFGGTSKSDTTPQPIYFECRPSEIFVYPGEHTVSIGDIGVPGNAVEKALDRIEKSAGAEYAILIVRPGSVQLYRHLRRMVRQKTINVGYDVLERDSKIDWLAEAKALNLQAPK